MQKDVQMTKAETTGRLIAFDAKSTDAKNGFAFASHKSDRHQRFTLRRFGAAGAISGLVVRSTVQSAAYWIDHSKLQDSGSIPWADCIRLGDSTAFDIRHAWEASA